MRVTATVPVRVGAAPALPLGAKNERTGQMYSGTFPPAVWTAMVEAEQGDTIVVNPGVYVPFALTVRKTLTLKSAVPGTKYTIDGGGNQYRIFDLAAGVGITIEDAEIRNNKKQYANEAGIYPTYGPWNVVLRRCILHDLNNGILVGVAPGEVSISTVLMEDCEIYDCGDNGGQTHNIYVGNIANFTMRRCKSHMKKQRGDPGVPAWDISWGHLIKSRARVTLIEDCDLFGGRGEANRCIDLPNGGDATIRRCRMEYRSAQNNGVGQLIGYGMEEGRNFSAFHSKHRLIIEDNIAVNRNLAASNGALADFIWVLTTGNAGTQVIDLSEYSVKRNVFSGVGMPNVKGDQKWAIPLTPESGNRVVPLTAFVDVDNYDWRLK